MVKTLTGETAYTFVSLDSLVVVELASSLHNFAVVEVSVYVREYGEDLVFAQCVHGMGGGLVFVGRGCLSCWPVLLSQMWIHILGTGHSHLENVKQLIVRKIFV